MSLPNGANYTITYQTDWNTRTKKLDSITNNSSIFYTKNTDFQNNQLLVAIDSVRLNGGWIVDILSVKEY